MSIWLTDRWFMRPHVYRSRKTTPLSLQALWIAWLRFGVALAWR